MNELKHRDIVRLLLFILIQVLILKRIVISAPFLNLIHVFLFPLALLLMPFGLSRMTGLFIAFFAGLILDFFYDSPGVIAASSVLLMYMRAFILKWLEPRGGYIVQSKPALGLLGRRWVISYTSIGMGVFLVAYFSLEAFSPVYIISILAKSIMSFLTSMVFVLFYMFVLYSGGRNA